jgi:hypothetical protein
MKSFSIQFLSAIGAGALAALFLHATPSVIPRPLRVLMTKAAAPAARHHAQGRMIATVSPSAPAARALADARPADFKNGDRTLLLNEPVDILNQNSATWTSLPRGTSVKLLASRGSLLQVRHGSDVVTLPSSTVVSGVSRTN